MEKLDAPINVMLTQSDKDRLHRIAAKDRRKPGEYARKIILDALDKEERA